MYSACIHDSISATEHIPDIESIVSDHLRRKTFPGANLAVRRRGTEVYRLTAGYRALHPRVLPMTPDTPFDLASLTKPLATTVMVLRTLEHHGLTVETRLGDVLSLDSTEVARVTISQLLTHTSGLPPTIDIPARFLDAAHIDTQHARDLVRAARLEREPGSGVVYSCTGYLLLGLFVEVLTDQRLREAWRDVTRNTPELAGVRFPDPHRPMVEAAATERCAWRDRWICGVVHDETSFCLGGDGGNAGLFASLDGVLGLLSILGVGGVLGSVRVLGQDAVRLVTSCRTPDLTPRRSAGYLMEGPEFPFGGGFGPGSFGHTGFTGTSVVVDPDAELEIVVLTNRVHLGRKPTAVKILEFRREIHPLLRRLFA